MPETKACSKCSLIKEISEFYKDKRIKSGYGAECKSCRSAKISLWQQANKDKCHQAQSRWKEKNRETLNARSRERYTKQAEAENIRSKKWREDNPEKESIRKKKWRKNNRDKWIECVVGWKKRNPERVAEISRKAREKRKSIPKYQISKNISGGIRKSIQSKKARRHWEQLVGFTISQLMEHLERLFKPGMTWENYGTHWHIDHKTPIAVFNFDKPEHIDFRLCWSLSNLQPLEAKENISKGAKIDKPFQPSLPLAVND
jgi:hypothetical protein